MKCQRIFSALLVTTLMMFATAIAHAQSGAVPELKRRIMDQVISGARQPAVERAVKPLTQNSDGQKPGNYPKKNALAGTWDLVLTFSDGFEVKSTLQVFPGAADGEGSCTHASEFSLTLPNPTLPEQGSWRYVKGDEYIASYKGYSYTELLAPFGTIGFRHAVTMGANQETFTGQAVFEVFDAAGNVLFADNLQTRGVRQHPLGP